jgi:hypothetical protein
VIRIFSIFLMFFRLDIQGCSSGSYFITYELLGNFAAKYAIVFPVGNSFTFLTPESRTRRPTVISARFTSNLFYIEVRFDSDTNLAKKGFDYFLCSNVFVFRGSSQTSCVWKSASTLYIINDASSSLVPGKRRYRI